jgi:transketolase
MNVEPIGEKWTAFGWDVSEINGHDFTEIDRAIRLSPPPAGVPKLIVANTVKGKGVSFMEDSVPWHGLAPNAEQTAQALEEIWGAKL